jgi:hypothetical protein
MFVVDYTTNVIISSDTAKSIITNIQSFFADPKFLMGSFWKSDCTRELIVPFDLFARGNASKSPRRGIKKPRLSPRFGIM